MKKIRLFICLILCSFSFNSCTFDLASGDSTIELPNTYGINVELVFLTPKFILEHDVTFSDLLIHYTIHKNDAFVANIKFYVSSDQNADNIQNPGDEDILNVNMGLNETEKSGTASSQLLVDILNNKQPKFVIGAQNLSINPISTVYIDVDVQYKGSYKL